MIGVQSLRGIALCVVFVLAGAALASPFTSTQSGDWNDTNTWGGVGVPGSGDDVTITSNHVVTVSDARLALTVTLDSTAGNKMLVIDSTGSLIVESAPPPAITINAPSPGSTNIIRINGGTLETSNSGISITGGASDASKLEFTSLGGTATFATDITFAGTAANALIDFGPSGGTVEIGGDLGNGGTLVNNTASLIRFNGSSAQTINSYTFNHFEVAKPGGTATLNGPIAVNGDLTITNGILDDGGFQISLNGGGTSTVSIGATGVLKLGSAATATTFPTPVGSTILAPGSAVVYQAGVAQTINSAFTYERLYVSTLAVVPVMKILSDAQLDVNQQLDVTDNGAAVVTLDIGTSALDVNGDITGDGTISVSSGSINIAGNWSATSTLSAGTSTVTYDGVSAQSVLGATYHDLVINKSAGPATFNGNATINGNLGVPSSGTLLAGTNTITLLGDATINSIFDASTGTLRFNGTAPQTFSSPFSGFFVENLEVNNVNDVGISSGGTTVEGSLLLNGGKVTVGTSFFIDVNATLTRNSGWLVGAVSIGLNSTPARTFPVGTAVAYLPVTVDADIPGIVTLAAIEGQHPDRTGPNVLDRYWQISTPATVTSLDSITFQYNLSDVTNGTEANYILAQYDGGSLTFTHHGAVNDVAHTATAAGVSSYITDWLVGQPGSLAAPSKLAITSINGGVDSQATVPFNVVVEAQDDNGDAAAVFVNTDFSLSEDNGTGNIGGTLTGTISAGNDSTTVTGVTYDTAEVGLQMRAVRTTGDVLTDGTLAFQVAAPPSTITVTNISDSGPGSLREAITTANTGGCTTPCTIEFSVAGTIVLGSALPAITLSDLTIDGTTAPGASENTNAFGQPSNAVITLAIDGSASIPIGFDVQETFVKIKGFAIQNFFNGGSGIGVKFTGDNSGSNVSGCHIGTNLAGNASAPNAYGVLFSASTESSVGGTLPAARNVISGNTLYGVKTDSAANTVGILGNYIGTNAALTGSLPNNTGIYVCSGCSVSIGGAGVGNVVSGNTATAIALAGGGADLKSNIIGPAGNSTTALPNATGIQIDAGSNFNTIGGISPTDANVISGNTQNGILANGDDSTIDNNWIGLAPDGTTPMGNGGSAVRIEGTASRNLIGTSFANKLVHNTNDGVTIVTTTGIGNVVRTNKIAGNSNRAIDIDDDGITANDATDADTGANNKQNFPVVSSAFLSGGTVTVKLTLDSSGGVSTNFFTFDVYKSDGSSQAVDSLGNSGCVAGNVFTNFTFGVASGSVFPGDTVVATATAYSDAACTTPGEGTSELSATTTVGGEIHWIAASGNWETASNWSPAVVPTTADDAYIDNSGSYTVAINSIVAVNSVHVGDGIAGVQTLNINPGTSLTLVNASDVATTGAISLSGGTLGGTGALGVFGQFDWSVGTLTGTGGLTMNAGSILDFDTASLKSINGPILTIAVGATANWNGGSINLLGGGNISNAGTFDAQGDASIIDSGSDGGFLNTGLFKKSSGAGTTGFVNVDFTNSGTIEIQTGTFNPGNLTSTGNIDLTGTLLVDDNTVTLNAGTDVLGTGLLHLTNGALVANTVDTLPNVQIDGGSFQGTANVSITALTWTNGTMEGTGTTTIPTGGTATLSGFSTKNLRRTLSVSNGGTVNIPGGGSISLQSGGNIANDGLVEATTGVQFNDGGSGGDFVNTRTFRVNSGGPVQFGNTTFNNNGVTALIDLVAGTLDLADGTSSGAFSLAGGTQLLFNSDTYTLAAGTTFVGTGNVNLSLGTLSVTGNVSIPSLNMSGGTLDGTGTLDLTGASTWTNGTMQGAGTTNVAAGGVLDISGPSAKSLQRTLSTAAGGAIDLSGTGPFNFANGGNVANGGAFRVTADQSINDSVLAGNFVNTGLFRKTTATGATTFSGVGFANNGGLVDLQSGILAINGDTFTQSAGTLKIWLNGTTAGTGFGQVNTNTTPSLAGTLEIALVGPYQPVGGDTFRVLSATSVTGDFTQPYTYPVLANSRTFSDAYDATGLLLTVNGNGDLSIAKSAPSNNVLAGDPIVYTLTIDNFGPDIANAVQVTDTLPAGHTGISANGTGWTCNVVGDTVTCNAATLPVGTAPDITINATAPNTPQTFINFADVTSANDPDNTDNQANWTITVDPLQADLDVSALSPSSPLAPGTPFTFDFTIQNDGPQTATSVSFSAPIPATLTYDSATPDAGSCNFAASTVTCNLGSILSGNTLSVVIGLTTTATAGTHQVTGTAAATETDPLPSNNAISPAVEVTGATITVTNTNDSGMGSLREALDDAGNGTCTPLPCTIDFNISGGGPHVIQPQSALPPVSNQTIVDATTQPGYVGTPIIQIDASVGPLSAGLGIAGNNSTVKGFSITGATTGIKLTGDTNSIEASYVGLTPAGIAAANGTGIDVSGNGNTIGGTTPAQRNVISGNTANGVAFSGSATGNTVSGNFIGTDPTGTSARPNDTGIAIVDEADSNTIGGATTAHGNVISGNTNYGISIEGAGSLVIAGSPSTNAAGDGIIDDTSIHNNFIGPDANGTASLGAITAGISLIDNATNTVIGGPGTGNVISGNANGITIVNSGVTATKIEGNLVGVAADAITPMGNTQAGIVIGGSDSNGIGQGAANVIANNGGDGVSVLGGTKNLILGNEFYNNADLGIDLGGDGVTPNDATDTDSGPNELQNSPNVASASLIGGGDIHIAYSIDSSGSPTGIGSIAFDLYEADPSGEGQTLLIGNNCFAANAFGAGTSFNAPSVAPGDLIVLTATSYTDAACTNVADGTSEFSNTVVAANCTPPAVTITGPTAMCAGGNVTLDAGPGFNSYLWSTGATTQTIIVSPGTTTNYSVTVTDNIGCPNSDTHTVTVNPLPAVTITGPATMCAGGNVTLDAGAGFTSYLWSNGATTQTINVSPAATTNYTVTVTDSNGCQNSDAHTVTVTAIPTVTIIGPTSTCGPTPVTLDAGPGFVSYNWSTGETTQQIVVNPGTTTTYSVTVSDGSCTANDTHTLTVNPVPSATITPSGPTTFCTGGSVTLTASAGTSWFWSNGATTQSINVTSSGTFTVQVFNASGCSATSAPVTVTATPTPIMNITGPTATCASTPVVLDAGAGFVNYAWSTGATSQQITVSPTATQTYSVNVTDGNGCTANDSHTVTVSANPTATITAPATVCENSTGNNASVASQAGATYNWTIGNGTITAGQGTNAITFTAGASGNVTLGITVTAGSCTSNGNASIPISAVPSVTITGPTSSCPGVPVTLDAGAGFTSYLWSNGATSQSITVSPTSTTNFSVTISNGSCTATDSHTVTMIATPLANITAPSSASPGEGGLNASVAPQGGATYAWSITNGTITDGNGTSSITFDAGASGSTVLNVTVTISGCSATDSHAVVIGSTLSSDVSITKTAPATAQSGGAIVYTIAVVNQGPDDAAGVTVTDYLPAGVTFLSVDGGSFGCVRTPTGVVCTGDLAANASSSITLTATASQQSGTITNVVDVSAASEDPNLANNVATATTNITSAPPTCATTPPALLEPADLANGTSPMTFSWSPVIGAVQYELWIDGAPVATTNTTATHAVSSGSHTWFVVAHLGNGCNPLTSPTRSFTIATGVECVAHTAPQIISPVGGNVGSPTTITWMPVPQAIGYRVWIEVDGTAAQDVGTTDGAVTLTVALPHGSIIIYVDARFSGCPDTRSAPVVVNVPKPDPCATRAAATPISPVNDAILNSSSVELFWNAVNGSAGYRVWASVDGETPQVLGATEETSLRATISRGLAVWWLETLFDGCASTESQRLRFTIPARNDCTQARPENVSPANDATTANGNVAFSWTAVPGAVLYELWVAIDHGTPALVGSTTDTTLTRLVPPGRLEWFVRALVDRCGPRDSQSTRFTFDPPEACLDHERPIPIQPLDGAKILAPADFAWHAVQNATSYDLFVFRSNEAPTFVGSTTATEINDVSLVEARLHWFVRANFGGGCPSLDSPRQELQILPTPSPCATLTWPVISAPGQISSGVPFLIHWTPIAGSTSYQLQIADNADFVGAQVLNTNATQHQLVRTNGGTTPVALFARVRALGGLCTPPTASPYGPGTAIFILPNGSAEGSAPLTGGVVTFIIPLGSELAGQTFTAVPKQPWLTVAPASGVVAAGGTNLVVTANTAGLPPGTSLGGLTVTLTTPAAGSAASNGTTTVAPSFSVTLVTPVTPTPGNTPPPDALIIPAVAHANGINAQFQSDVRVANTSPQLITYQVTFTPSGDSGITQGQQSTFSVEPGQTIALDDILESWFGTVNGTAFGSLEIRPLTETSSSTSSEAFSGLSNFVSFASSRTFNFTSNGTFGQYIPAVPFANFIGRAPAGAARTILSLQQIAQSPQYRTNLGLLEGSGQPADLLIRVFGENGQPLTDFPVHLNGGEHLQLGSFLATQGFTNLEDGRVEVEVLSEFGKVTAYASVLDNATNDPLLVTPVAVSDSGASKWVVPGVADVASGFANWQTDMRLFNAGTESVDATMQFYSMGGGAPKTKTVTLQPGEVKQFDEVLVSLFETTNDGGAVHVTTTDPARLVATARTYNQTGNGTYGQFISAVTLAETAGIESRPLQLLQVEESDRFRSNVGLVEVTGNPVKLEITMVPPDTKFSVNTELTLRANEFRQLGSLLSSFGLDDVHNGRVTVRVIEGTGRVTAYASVIDMLTNDPTYVPAQ